MKPDRRPQKLARNLAAMLRFFDLTFYVGLALILALVLFGI